MSKKYGAGSAAPAIYAAKSRIVSLGRVAISSARKGDEDNAVMELSSFEKKVLPAGAALAMLPATCSAPVGKSKQSATMAEFRGKESPFHSFPG